MPSSNIDDDMINFMEKKRYPERLFQATGTLYPAKFLRGNQGLLHKLILMMILPMCASSMRNRSTRHTQVTLERQDMKVREIEIGVHMRDSATTDYLSLVLDSEGELLLCDLLYIRISLKGLNKVPKSPCRR